MDEYLTIGEVARVLGVSPETVRRYEAQGRLVAERTPGGQRRFRRSALTRVPPSEKPEDDDDREPDDGERPERRAPTSNPPYVAPWEARRATAMANLDVTRAEIARRQEIRRYREERQHQLDTERDTALAKAAAAKAEAETRAHAARERAERTAELRRQEASLQTRISLLRMRMMTDSPTAQAEVERYLAEHARVGPPLTLIEAECEAILDKHRAAHRAAENQKVEAAALAFKRDLRRASLIRHGVDYAEGETSDLTEWDFLPAREAIAEVRTRLDAGVTSEWTERRVEREVDEILDEWS